MAISGHWWDPEPWKSAPLVLGIPVFVATLGLYFTGCLGGVVGAAIVAARLFRYLGQDIPRLYRER